MSLYLVTPVPHDDHDMLGVEAGHRREDVPQKRPTTHAVKDFGGRRLHPSALTGGEDDDDGRARAIHDGVCSPSGVRSRRHDTGRTGVSVPHRPDRRQRLGGREVTDAAYEVNSAL